MTVPTHRADVSPQHRESLSPPERRMPPLCGGALTPSVTCWSRPLRSSVSFSVKWGHYSCWNPGGGEERPNPHTLHPEYLFDGRPRAPPGHTQLVELKPFQGP